jgi:uncharacterized protein YoaH (UPF0181 family)
MQEKAVERLSRLEVVGMQEGNARKRKQERDVNKGGHAIFQSDR